MRAIVIARRVLKQGDALLKRGDALKKQVRDGLQSYAHADDALRAEARCMLSAIQAFRAETGCK
jgi:hypothetical protein